MTNTQISNQTLNKIITRIISAKHVFAKILTLKELERYAKERFDELKPIYEALLKSDIETYVIYEMIAPKEIAEKLRKLKQETIKIDPELRHRILQLVEEMVKEYMTPQEIHKLLNN